MKILFGSMPFEGHFNPLTSLAAHLLGQGHDVRFYAGASFATKLAAARIPQLPFRRAQEVTGQNLEQFFPDIAKLKGPKLIGATLKVVFFGNLEAHYRDLLEIHAEFPFDIIVHEGAFYASRLVHEKLGMPLYSIWPAPTPAPRAEGMPPPFFGLTPATSAFARAKHWLIDKMVESSTREGMEVLHELREREGLPPYVGSIFDFYNGISTRTLQVGTPGMDFPRPNLLPGWGFIGPLVGHQKTGKSELVHAERIAAASSVVVVSQGTVDNRDPTKLFIPTLEALKGGPHLVIATTGGRNTDRLRARFPESNVIVEDFIDFGALLPHTDVFVCNGGFGSVMYALMNGVPLVTAGKLEGKNDINVRLAYRGVAHDLKTERPSPRQVANSVARVLSDPAFGERARRLQVELASSDPFAIFDRALQETLPARLFATADAKLQA